MHVLDIVTITSAGLMAGAELSVSAFVNPALRQLESGPQARALSILARSLGRAMPAWYGFCLALLALESFLHRGQPAFAALLVSATIWAGMIVFSITMLVPINNRLAALNAATPAGGWESDHRRWDTLHRVRVLFLVVALVVLTSALTA